MNNHAQTWAVVEKLLLKERSDKLDELIRGESEQARAVIQFIDEMIERFPYTLSQTD